MHMLTLNDDEQALLIQLLESRGKELSHEIHRTDSHSYRDSLAGLQNTLEQLVSQLHKTEHVTASSGPLALHGNDPLENSRFLVSAMAVKCRDVIRGSNEEEKRLVKALHPKHLLWMCDNICTHAQEWPVTKLHRWIGFVQAAILANRMLALEQIKAMFNEVKKSQRVSSPDQDLMDHLDVDSSFKLDLGGQG